jgi:hypothetical protein
MLTHILSKKGKVALFIACSFLLPGEETVCYASVQAGSPARVRKSRQLYKLWAKTEDEKLIAAMKNPENQYKNSKGKILYDWKKIAQEMSTNEEGKGPTSWQCQNHWKNMLNPAINHGSWTPEEDELLMALYGQWKNDWKRIAQKMPSKNGKYRTNIQCRSRWKNKLDFDARHGIWTKEEDRLLIAAIKDPENQCRDRKGKPTGEVNWKKVAECVPDRTKVQCYDRYHKATFQALIRQMTMDNNSMAGVNLPAMQQNDVPISPRPLAGSVLSPSPIRSDLRFGLDFSGKWDDVPDQFDSDFPRVFSPFPIQSDSQFGLDFPGKEDDIPDQFGLDLLGEKDDFGVKYFRNEENE